MTAPFLMNHLWQSSCFALIVGLLAFALRKNSPKVRYWVWLSASLKFLIPFALLVSLGSVVPHPARRLASIEAPVFPNTYVQIADPFSPSLLATVPARAPRDWVAVAIGGVWALGFLALTLARYRSWLGVRAALRASTPIELPIPVPALITPGAEEPGIVGFLRPVLLLPPQLPEHLNPRQLGAVLAHELCHVRRRDNFFAAVHMVVEAIFWFHPLVWWIGSRMVEERELACDEEVLRLGCEPTDYVGGILKVCRFCTESPLQCVSGVTGADVKRRLRAILAGSVSSELNAAKKITLAMIRVAALAAPILIGVLNAPAIRAQNAPANAPKFEVASIKPAAARSDVSRTRWLPGGRVDLHDVTVEELMVNAWHIFPDQIVGAPPWIRTAAYDIAAKPDTAAKAGEVNLMMQSLLRDRFGLAIHHETRTLPIYAVVMARKDGTLGPSFVRSKEGGCVVRTPGGPLPPPPDPAKPATRWCGLLMMRPRKLSGAAVPIVVLVEQLSLRLGHTVIDMTGLKGDYDIDLEWTSDEGAFPLLGGSSERVSPPDPNGQTILDGLKEQLGLKIESRRAPVDVIVIDHVERPSAN